MGWRARPGPAGMTLVELILALAAISLVAAAFGGLLSTALRCQDVALSESSTCGGAEAVLDEMVREVRDTVQLLRPSAASPSGSVLSFSAGLNADGDYYQGDLRYPRRDEDPPGDANMDAAPGISGVDDDGDGTVDESNFRDDDEDGLVEEDGPDIVSYGFDALNQRLIKVSWDSTVTLVSEHVSAFSAVYQPADSTHNARVSLSLTLLADDGSPTTVSETVYPRNLLQLNGKVVR